MEQKQQHVQECPLSTLVYFNSNYPLLSWKPMIIMGFHDNGSHTHTHTLGETPQGVSPSQKPKKCGYAEQSGFSHRTSVASLIIFYLLNRSQGKNWGGRSEQQQDLYSGRKEDEIMFKIHSVQVNLIASS